MLPGERMLRHPGVHVGRLQAGRVGGLNPLPLRSICSPSPWPWVAESLFTRGRPLGSMGGHFTLWEAALPVGGRLDQHSHW